MVGIFCLCVLEKQKQPSDFLHLMLEQKLPDTWLLLNKLLLRLNITWHSLGVAWASFTIIWFIGIIPRF